MEQHPNFFKGFEPIMAMGVWHLSDGSALPYRLRKDDNLEIYDNVKDEWRTLVKVSLSRPRAPGPTTPPLFPHRREVA